MPTRLFSAAVVGLFVLATILAVHSHRQKAATFDEVLTLGTGLRMVAADDVRVPMDYGPLVRWMSGRAIERSGTPLALTPERLPWAPALTPADYQRVLYLENDPEALLGVARLAMLPLHLGLLAFVLAFSHALWGREGALVSLAFAALSPTVLAHGRLATNDVAVATFLAGTFFFAYRTANRFTALDAAATGLTLGLAMLAKFSALFAVPVLAACFAVRAAMGRPWPAALGTRSIEATCPRRRSALALGSLVVTFAVAGTTVWAFYGFEYAVLDADDPAYAGRAVLLEEFRERGEVSSDFQRVVLDTAEQLRVLPESYLLAVRYTLQHMEYRLSYFMGERSIEGFPGYFVAAFALKTPIATQALLVAVLGALVARRLRLDPIAALFLWAFPTLYFAYALTSNINLGQRYLLPIYPAIFVLLGGAAELAAAGRAWRAGLAGALVWVALGTAWIHPDYLAYFNAAAGGPRGGSRYLGGSNLDWGQDLERLGPWLAEHGVEHVRLGYFGTALPEYYAKRDGFTFEHLASTGYLNDATGGPTVAEGAWVAVGATALQGFYLQDMDTYRFLDAFEPVDVIGHTLFLYRIDRDRLRPSATPARQPGPGGVTIRPGREPIAAPGLRRRARTARPRAATETATVIANCQDLTELITDYLEGRLGLVDRLLFRVHIAGCSNCKTYVSQMRDTVVGLDGIAPPAMPDDVRDELLDRFRDWKRI